MRLQPQQESPYVQSGDMHRDAMPMQDVQKEIKNMLCSECKIQMAEFMKGDVWVCSYCFDTENTLKGLHFVRKRYIRIDRDLAIIESMIDRSIERGDQYVNPTKILHDVKNGIHMMRRSLYFPVNVKSALIAKFRLPADSKFINIEDGDIPRQPRKHKVMFHCQNCGVGFIRKTFTKEPKFCSRKCFEISKMKTIDVSILDKVWVFL